MDITYINEKEKTVFNFRIGLLIRKNGKYLIQEFKKSKFFSFIGGRVKTGESTIDAAIRECKEETGIEIKQDDLMLFTTRENFFTFEGKEYHEILFIYEVKNEEVYKLKEFTTKDNQNSYNSWFTLDEIKILNFKPEIMPKNFGSKKIRNHIIFREK